MENKLPKRAIAVVQATVTHTLSSVPVIPKYGFPLPTDSTAGSELSMEGEVMRGENREAKDHHIIHSRSFSNGSRESNLLYKNIEAIRARIDLPKRL